MPVPGYEEFMLPMLRLIADGGEHNVRDVRDQLASEFKLTPADRAEMLASGKQSVFDNRVGWAKTYLDKAGLLASVKRGVYRITDAGKSVVERPPSRLDRGYLTRFEPFRAFLSLQHTADEAEDEPDTSTGPDVANGSATPEEQLETAYRKIRQKVEAEVLEAVAAASPQFFEKLVVDLLVQMGYGGSRADAGKALGRTGDGGIDGIINEDRLGLDAIYVQAKRWVETTVGRPEVQKFAGSLMGRRGRKGVFITTASFSKDAHDYVKQIDAKIILIDGAALAAYMVDFGIGVNPVSTFEVKRVDSDYFSEE
jgi:restriction system protein